MGAFDPGGVEHVAGICGPCFRTRTLAIVAPRSLATSMISPPAIEPVEQMASPFMTQALRVPLQSRWRVGALLGAALLMVGGALVIACGGSDSNGVGDSKLPSGSRGEDIAHEACTESGNKVDVVDANGDGKPDIRRVYKGGKEICRTTDLNHDGVPDLYEYFDASGQVRRREADYDGSGVVDAIEYYQGGKLIRRELDTTGQHRIDTWDFFDASTGKVIRRERDTTNDGRVDQWWTYDGDKVTIAFDKNNDGKPDPADTIVLGADGTSAAPSTQTAAVDAGPPQSTAMAISALDAGSPLAPLDAGAANSSPSTSKPNAGKKK